MSPAGSPAIDQRPPASTMPLNRQLFGTIPRACAITKPWLGDGTGCAHVTVPLIAPATAPTGQGEPTINARSST